MVFVLPSRGDGSQCAAVEARAGAQDHRCADLPLLVAIFPSQLDRGFIGLCSGITEEDRIGAAVGADPLRQQLLFRNPVEVGDVLDAAKLGIQCSLQSPVAVPKRAGGDASDAIKKAAPFTVLHPNTVPFGERQRKTAISGHDGGRFRLLRGHGGIGRRSALKMRRLRLCRFESDCPHLKTVALDVGSNPIELAFEIVVTAIKVLQALDHGDAFSC